MIPMYNTKNFNDIFSSYDEFALWYRDLTANIAKPIDDYSSKILYYLLYARYGNSPIKNNDIEQFKFKVFDIIFRYGPTWVKKLEIQKRLREMSEEELMTGAKNINNHSYNPSTEPATGCTGELPTINEQTANHFRKGKLEGYGYLIDLLEEDVTGLFVSKFADLFKQFVQPEHIYIYVTEEGEDYE